LLNAIAVIMVASGWQIYNASPIFGSAFPSALTLGGCLAGETLRALLLVVNIMSKWRRALHFSCDSFEGVD
jgi:thiosulfate reductase cytochrome b subunit